MTRKYRSGAMAAIHETASDLHSVGGIDQKNMSKFDALCLTPVEEMTSGASRDQALDRTSSKSPDTFQQ